jgi:hypothetical protein
VCGAAALYATTAEGIAAHLRRLHDDPGSAPDGRAHAASFSWRACAEEHARAYTLAVR